MCTEKEALEKIMSLTELELISFIESLRDHLDKQSLSEAVISALGGETDDFENEIHNLSSQVDELEKERDEILEQRNELQDTIDDIKRLLQ